MNLDWCPGFLQWAGLSLHGRPALVHMSHLSWRVCGSVGLAGVRVCGPFTLAVWTFVVAASMTLVKSFKTSVRGTL